MTAARKFLAWGTLGLCAVIMLLFTTESNTRNSPGVAAQMGTPAQRIESKARLASPDDENSIRALADEIFNHPHPFPRMPADMENFVKARLVRAEMAYLQGVGPAVQERDIVRLVNSVANKLGVPEYGKTSEHQVRVLRMGLALSSPTFMGRGMARGDIKVGQRVEPTMSPLQAAHLIGRLIDQKFSNPDYQLTPAEWEKDQYANSVERWRTLRELIQSGELETSPRKTEVILRQNPKRKEMADALSRGMSSMNWSDAWDAIDQAFATLNIKQ